METASKAFLDSYADYRAAKEVREQASAIEKRKLRKLVRVSGLKRKKVILIPVSESHCVKIQNNYLGSTEVFAPAFGKKYEVREVKRTED